MSAEQIDMLLDAQKPFDGEAYVAKNTNVTKNADVSKKSEVETNVAIKNAAAKMSDIDSIVVKNTDPVKKNDVKSSVIKNTAVAKNTNVDCSVAKKEGLKFIVAIKNCFDFSGVSWLEKGDTIYCNDSVMYALLFIITYFLCIFFDTFYLHVQYFLFFGMLLTIMFKYVFNKFS